MHASRKTILRERLNTVDLLVRVACFASKVTNIFNIKTPDLNKVVNGTEPFPFIQCSLMLDIVYSSSKLKPNRDLSKSQIE